MADSTYSEISEETGGSLTAKEQILALARTHRVVYHPTKLDEWADAITRLSGDDVALDDIELLLLALERGGCVSTKEADCLQLPT
jgi:hypothetical protein